MELLTSYPVKISDLGFHGNLFGGQLLKILDWSAVAFASRKTMSPRMVTVSIDQCNFIKSVGQGELINIYGDISEIGNTSVTVKLSVKSYNVMSSSEETVLRTNMTFVRIDEDGNPERIPR